MNRILDTQWNLNRLVLDSQVSLAGAEEPSGAYILSPLRTGYVENDSRIATLTNESRMTIIRSEARIVNA